MRVMISMVVVMIVISTELRFSMGVDIMTLAGLGPAIFGSEDQRLIH